MKLKHIRLTPALACAAALIFNTCAYSAPAQNADRPNVVVILIDDMGFSDLQCYGGDVPTPNINKLAREGVTQLMLVPVSFVSEHSETLYEMDILYRDLATQEGIAQYRRVPTMNCRPDFIEALATLVERALPGSSNGAARTNCIHSPVAANGAAPSCACDRANG